MAAGYTSFYIDVYKMASLLCECGDEFRAQCDGYASGFSIAWVLLLMYMALHNHDVRVCTWHG